MPPVPRVPAPCWTGNKEMTLARCATLSAASMSVPVRSRRGRAGSARTAAEDVRPLRDTGGGEPHDRGVSAVDASCAESLHLNRNYPAFIKLVRASAGVVDLG